MGRKKQKTDDFEEVPLSNPIDQAQPMEDEPSNESIKSSLQQPMGKSIKPIDQSIDSAPEIDQSIVAPREFYQSVAAFTEIITNQSVNEEQLITALMRFIAQVKSEHQFSMDRSVNQSMRLKTFLVADYLRKSPELSELFNLLDRSSASYPLIGRVIDAINCCLMKNYHSHAVNEHLEIMLTNIVRKFCRSHLNSVYRLLGLEDTRLISSAMRLLRTMIGVNNQSMREVALKFNWTNKGLLSLPNRPFYTKDKPSNQKATQPKKPSTQTPAQKLQQWKRLRAEFIQMIQTLLHSHDADVLGHILAIKGLVTAPLKHLSDDPLITAHAVLSSMIGILHQPLTDSVKYGLFSSYVLEHIMKLYDSGDQAVDQEIPSTSEMSELAHAFITSLLHHLHDSHAQSIKNRSFTSWPFHKNILQRLMDSLNPSINQAHRSHALYILTTFPSLYPGYLGNLSMAFDPRLSARYIANVSWLMDCLTVSIDGSHLMFLLNDTTNDLSFLQTLFNYCMPQALGRVILSQSLQSKQSINQLIGCSIVSALVDRFEKVMDIVRSNSSADDKQLMDRISQSYVEMKNRLPDIQVMFAMRLKFSQPASQSEDASTDRMLFTAMIQMLIKYQTAIGQSTDRAMNQSKNQFDWFKLLSLVVPDQSTNLSTNQCQLKLLQLLNMCNSHPKIFSVTQLTKEANKPRSQFGQLLSIMISARDTVNQSSDQSVNQEAQDVYQSSMQLITRLMYETQLFGLSPLSMHQSASQPNNLHIHFELSNLMDLITAQSINQVESLFAFITSKSSVNALKSNAIDGLSHVLSTLLAPLYQPVSQSTTQSSTQSLDDTIAVVCELLSRTLSAHQSINPSVHKVAEHIISLTDDRPSKKSKVDPASAVVSETRNQILIALMSHTLFAEIQKQASRLIDGSINQSVAQPLKSAKKSRKSTAGDSSSLVETHIKQLSNASVNQSTNQSALRLSLSTEPQSRAVLLKSITQATSQPVMSFVHSLPMFSVLPVIDQSIQTVSQSTNYLCVVLIEKHRTPLQQILDIFTLKNYLIELGAFAAKQTDQTVSECATKMFVSLAAALNSLIFADQTINQSNSQSLMQARIYAAFANQSVDQSIDQSMASLLMCDNVAISSAVALLLHQSIDHSITLATKLPQFLSVYFEQLVDQCVTLSQLPCPSTTSRLPRPFTLLQGFAPFFSSAQLKKVASAFLPVQSPDQSNNDKWLTLLSINQSLAVLLFSTVPDQSINQLTRLATQSESQSESIDGLILQLLGHSSQSNSLAPYDFFTHCLTQSVEQPTSQSAKMQIVAVSLKSAQRLVLIDAFAQHLSSINKSVGQSDGQFVDWIDSCSAYLKALPVVFSESADQSTHQSAVESINQLLQSKWLSIVADVKESPSQCVILDIIASLIDNNWLSVDQRQQFVHQLLNSQSAAQVGLTSAQAHACRILLSIDQSTSQSNSQLIPAVSSFLLQTMKALTKLYKTESSNDQSVNQLEKQLTEVLHDLLDRDHVLPVTNTIVHRIPSSNHSTKRSINYPITLSSLLAVSSADSLIKIVNRFLTGSLRSRFHQSTSQSTVFLLVSLFIKPEHRSIVGQALSFDINQSSTNKSIHSLMSGPSQVPELTSDMIDDCMSNDSLEGLFTPQNLFDLICTHSSFLEIFSPVVMDPSNQTLNQSSEASRTNLRISILQSVYLFFVFPIKSPGTSINQTIHQSPLNVVLYSLYNATYAPLDRLLFGLFVLFESLSVSQSVDQSIDQSVYRAVSCRRRWGLAGRADIERRIFTGESFQTVSHSINQSEDDLVWIYNNFTQATTQRGPLLSHITPKIAPTFNPMQISQSMEDSQSAGTSADQSVNQFDDYDCLPALEQRYDSHFVLPFLIDCLKNFDVDLRRLIECSLISYTMECTAHQSLNQRKYAYRLIARVVNQMEINQGKEKEQADLRAAAKLAKSKPAKATNKSDDIVDEALPSQATAQPIVKRKFTFPEQTEIQYLFTLFKQSLSVPYQRIPPLIACFFSRAINQLMNPSGKLYKPLTNYLSINQTINFNEVPMFSTMLYSNHVMDWKTHRSFLLRLIDSSLFSLADASILESRHVYTMFLNHFQSPMGDRLTRQLMLQTIKQSICVPTDEEMPIEGASVEQSTESINPLLTLCKKHSLFVWIRQMIQSNIQSVDQPSSTGSSVNQTVELAMPTLIPIIELALTLATQLTNRLPSISQLTTQSDAPIAQSNDQAAKALTRQPTNQSDSDSDSSESDDDDDEMYSINQSINERLKDARRLARRRLGMAQDAAELMETLMHRTVNWINQSNDQSKQQSIQSVPAIEQSEQVPADASMTPASEQPADQSNDQSANPSMLSFHGTKRSTSVDQTIGQLCLSTLHQCSLLVDRASRAAQISQASISSIDQAINQSMVQVCLSARDLLILIESNKESSDRSTNDQLFDIVMSSTLADSNNQSVSQLIDWAISHVINQSTNQSKLLRLCQWLNKTVSNQSYEHLSNEFVFSLISLYSYATNLTSIQSINQLLTACVQLDSNINQTIKQSLKQNNQSIKQSNVIEQSLVIQDLFLPSSESRVALFNGSRKSSQISKKSTKQPLETPAKSSKKGKKSTK